jgi:hypothetical protein
MAFPMVDRRKFLATSVSLAAGSRLVAGPLIVAPEPPALLVCDRRFQAHLGAMSSRTEVVFINGNVTALWRDRLHSLWRTGSTSVAGMTEPAALFCLEQLARGCGRKVSMRQPIAGTHAIRWVISPVSSRGLS